VLIADITDKDDAQRMGSEKLRVVCANTLMKSTDDKRELARLTLAAVATPQSARA